MSNVIEAKLGVTVGQAAQDAVEELKKGPHSDGNLMFNGLMVPFSTKSDPDDIATIYTLMHRVSFLKNKIKNIEQ